MNCTCHAYPNPDCPRHGWPELRELDPTDEDRIARAEAMGVVVTACLFLAILAAAFALGLSGWRQAMAAPAPTADHPVNP